jgi:hypothetical protein
MNGEFHFSIQSLNSIFLIPIVRNAICFNLNGLSKIHVAASWNFVHYARKQMEVLMMNNCEL